MDVEGHRSVQFTLFRRVGYQRLPTTVPAELVQAMRDVIESEITAARRPYRVNDRGEIHRIDALVDRHPIFLEVLRRPEIVEPLQALLGPSIYLLRNRHNHATVNRAGDIGYRLHRDILQWSRPILTAIIYLEEATVDNGCTHVVPGSHFLGFAGMPPDGGGGNWADDHSDYDAVHGQALPVPMPAGGVLVFDSLMFHSVGLNHSGRSRLSASFAFHSVDEMDETDNPKRVVLCGQRVYKGNDRHYGTTTPVGG